jgi:rsbT co-antagonist protein RsbR
MVLVVAPMRQAKDEHASPTPARRAVPCGCRCVVARPHSKLEKEDSMSAEKESVVEALPEPKDVDRRLLHELIAYLRDSRTELRQEWVQRITDAQLRSVMTSEEIFSEVTAVYDNYVDALETGSVETLQAYARDLSERIIPRGVETHEVLGIVLLLRDVLARALFVKYQHDADLLNRILDAYEPAANRIAVTVGVSFVEERERVIREQQEAIRELSTPVLQVRERLLILPIIGVLDSARARQLTEQLLGAIQSNRAKVVVIDITGVATIDVTVANHLVQTVESARLMGASAIITGLSSKIAQTLVDLGVDLSMMRTVGDLQGGLEEAERLIGYKPMGEHRAATAST